jgi:hypothetical protein
MIGCTKRKLVPTDREHMCDDLISDPNHPIQVGEPHHLFKFAAHVGSWMKGWGFREAAALLKPRPLHSVWVPPISQHEPTFHLEEIANLRNVSRIEARQKSLLHDSLVRS